LKKIAQSDAIFDNVAQANQTADANPKSLRLSIDSKAKVIAKPKSKSKSKSAISHAMAKPVRERQKRQMTTITSGKPCWFRLAFSIWRMTRCLFTWVNLPKPVILLWIA